MLLVSECVLFLEGGREGFTDPSLSVQECGEG